MKINAESQFGLSLKTKEREAFIKVILNEQHENIYAQQNIFWLFQEEAVFYKKLILRGDEKALVSEKYLITTNALNDLKKIRVDLENENFSFQIFEDIPLHAYVTFLLGKDAFIKFIRTEVGIMYGYRTKEGDFDFTNVFFGADIKKEIADDPAVAHRILIFQLLIYVYLSDIQTKTILNPGEKINIISDGKCKNDSKEQVTLVDVNWNQRIERIGKIGVRGFYRLQRYGKAWGQIKIIWINDFVKSGYARKAGKEL
jgi:hypothetical protein